MIDWHAAHGCYSDLERRGFLSLLPPHARNSMPDVGDAVLYFGDGHLSSVQTEVCVVSYFLLGVKAIVPYSCCIYVPSLAKRVPYLMGNICAYLCKHIPFLSHWQHEYLLGANMYPNHTDMCTLSV